MLLIIESQRIGKDRRVFVAVFDFHPRRDLPADSLELLFDRLLVVDERVVKVVLCDAHLFTPSHAPMMENLQANWVPWQVLLSLISVKRPFR